MNITASRKLRLLYCLTLLGGIFPAALFGASGWVGLATGGGLFGWLGTGALVVLVFVLHRVYQVIRFSSALDARAGNFGVKALRVVGILGMLVGTLATLGMFFSGPLTLMIFGKPGDGGVAFFFTGVMLYMLSTLGWLGWFLFELSRLIGGKSQAPVSAPGEKPAVRRIWSPWALAVIAALVIAGAYFLPSLRGKPCGERYLAECVAEISQTVTRTVELAPATEVLLDSNVGEIVYQRTANSGKRVRWKIEESPDASLRALGAVPQAAGEHRVKIKIRAIDAHPGLSLSVEVFDGEQKIARLDDRIKEGYRLEPIASTGAPMARLVIDMPARATSGAKTPLKDAGGRQYLPEQLFVFFRNVFKTELEAQADAKTVVRQATLVRTDSGGGSLSQDELSKASGENAAGNTQCAGIAQVRPGTLRSPIDSTGRMLWEVYFTRSAASAPLALVEPNESLICAGDAIWLVSYVYTRPSVQFRKYTTQGELVLSVKTTLPAIDHGRFGFDLIAAGLLRESAGRLSFERWEAGVEGAGVRVRKKEVYELLL